MPTQPIGLKGNTYTGAASAGATTSAIPDASASVDFATWRRDLYAALLDLRGNGGLDDQGATMPAATPLDTIAVLGQFAGPLTQAMTLFEAKGGKGDGVVANSKYVNADGQLWTVNILPDGATLAIRDYLVGTPGSTKWRRAPLGSTDTYEPYVSGASLDQLDYLSFVRETIDAWQDVVDTSARAIMNQPMALGSMMTQADDLAFWSAVRRLCGNMDVIKAAPLPGGSARIKQALRGAVNDTEQFLGKTAAEVANETGNLAGNVGKGFLGGLGLTGLAVAAIAVYLLMR